MKIDIRRVFGILLGLAFVAEGGLLASYAAPTVVDGVGGLQESTVLIAGVQLAILGILVFSGWFVMDLEKITSRPKVGKILNILFLVANLVVMCEGLFLTINATKVTFEGGETFGPVAAALLSAQLFGLGALSSSLWIKRGKVVNPLAWTVGVAASIALLSLGAMLIGVAAPLRTALIENIGEGKMTVAGTIVMIFSGLLVLAFLFDGTKYFQGKVGKIFEVLFVAIIAAFVIGSVYLSSMAEYFELGDSFAAGKMYMGAFFAIVFMVSSLALSSWWSRKRAMTLSFLIESIGIISAIALAGIGVEVFALAGESKVEGLFTLPHILVLLIAAQLVVLPSVCLGIYLVREMRFFAAPLVRGFLATLMMLVASLIAFEGIAISIAAARTHIVGFGTVLEGTVGLLGLGIAGLGILLLVTWNLREGHSSPRMRRIELLMVFFLMLLLIASIAL